MALRLPAPPAPPGHGPPVGPGPVVLFLPAHLLAKGHRYLEVPIGYRFRTTGRSFVRPLRYLRQVVPAVWRELNPVAGNLEASSSVEVVPDPPAPARKEPIAGSTAFR
jgi:hypothetical protein